jgi:hypothetical protein
MADPAMAAARAVDQLTDEALPGLPMTDVDRVESDLLAEDFADGPCVPLTYGCTGAPHRFGCTATPHEVVE